jgi:signal transduction histidine kinase
MKLLTLTCLVSAILSLVFGLVIITLRRSARILQEKKWANPFALTFFVLAVMYSLRFIGLLTEEKSSAEPAAQLSRLIEFLVYSASGLTNYLFLLAAFRLSEPALRERWLRILRKILTNHAPLSLTVLCLAGLLQILEKWNLVRGWKMLLVLTPDAIFSALALVSMGLVLFRNIRFRRDRLMARVVLFSSVCYAVLYISYQLKLIEYLIDGRSPLNGSSTPIADLLMFFSSLLLKFGLFFPAYSLMLLVSAPLTGIERLLKNVTRKDKEYLENGGIVKSICDELRLSRVRLYIRLPGDIETMAVFAYSPTSDIADRGPKVIEYKTDSDYDLVINRGEPKIVNREDYTFLRRISRVMVPLYFHDSVIACLEVEASEERFTEVDLSNLKRIATMISPAVQTYREIFALNRLSQDLVRSQIEVRKYDFDKNVKKITRIVHDIISPSVTGISIENGFFEYRKTYPDKGVLRHEIEQLLDREIAVNDFTVPDRTCRWLAQELRIPVQGLLSEPIFGKFIFGVKRGKEGTKHPTIGTNPACRQALSDLLTDTLLDFIRGYLNQLTDELGVRLSGLKSTTILDWHREVGETARGAKLLWTVSQCSDREERILGDDEHVSIVRYLEGPSQRGKWNRKTTTESEQLNEPIEIWFQTTDESESETRSVIRLILKGAQATLWFGVGRQGFGPELDYVSPWQYFLNNFGKIADSALLRLLIMEERHKLMAELHNIVAGTMLSGIIAHDLKGLATDLEGLALGLDGLIVDRDRGKELIRRLKSKADFSKELRGFVTNVSDLDKRRPCSLAKAVKRAWEIADSSRSDKIRFKKVLPDDDSIDVPFHAVANTLAIVVNNAKYAVQNARGEDSRIEICANVSEDERMVICDVIDSGPGVPEDEIPTLFKSPIESKKNGGTGVGLYFSRYLLRLYGADIEYLSQNDGAQKTTFRLLFPRP